MKIIIAKQKGKVSKILLDEFAGLLSFGKLCQLLRNKDIKLNGVRIKQDALVEVGDELTVYYDGEAPKIESKVIFEDENIKVSFKPKGVTSEMFFESEKSLSGELYFCHRLDRNTDGLMLFAKNNEAYEEILGAFKAKTFEKFYRAEVFGKLEKDGRLENYLLKDEQKGLVKIFNKPTKNAQKAILEYNIISVNENSTKVFVKLLTGRTHQIRAQFAHIGHFVLGDGKYGDDRINRELNVKEMKLTACEMVLHFQNGQKLAYLDGARYKI